jgi:multiple antibiotic resistance protein
VKLLVAASSAWLATFALLLASTFLLRFMTRRRLVAVERLMGMVLVALAVQLFLDGMRNAFAWASWRPKNARIRSLIFR